VRPALVLARATPGCPAVLVVLLADAWAGPGCRTPPEEVSGTRSGTAPTGSAPRAAATRGVPVAVARLDGRVRAAQRAGQVAGIRRERIASGDITPGLPSLKTITQEYGVSHVTAEKAVALLREEGLVVVVIGRGAFVARDRG
jgi:Bacterial regulatory proteins, gntR family